MPVLFSSEGYKIEINNKNDLLNNPIISQFDKNTKLPLSFQHLQLMVNGLNDIIRDENFILEHIELLKKLVLENHIKLYLLKYYEFFNNLNEDVYQYLTIYDMHLLDEKYIHDFLNGRFNYASHDEKDKIIKIKGIRNIMEIEKLDVNREIINNIKNKNDYESIVGNEIIIIPYIIKLFLKYWLYKIIEYASDDVKNNFEFIKFACYENGIALKYASDQLKDNFEIVKIACSNFGWALRYASERLRNNYKIVKSACSDQGYTLQYASPILKNNLEIVTIACNQHGLALNFASEELMNNPELIKIKEDFINNKHTTRIILM